MIPTIVCLVNQSRNISHQQVVVVAQALTAQLAHHVAPIWGSVPALEVATSSGHVPPGAVPCYISDTPDVPGAAGYHDEGPDGIPYIKIFDIPGMDWRVTLSHELIELVGDAAANKWADMSTGNDIAFELCDPVESDTYLVLGIPVSNFVYPSYFDPKARPNDRMDFLGKLIKPGTLTPGGYQIIRTEGGNISQVFGSEYPNDRKAMKMAKACRRRSLQKG